MLASCGRIAFDPGAQDATPSEVTITACDTIPGIVFCEDFEGPPKLVSVEAEPPSLVVADTSRAYRGATSLHARTTRAVEAAWRLGGVLPTVTGGELYARWYHYEPSTNPHRRIGSIHLVESSPPFNGVIFGLTDGNIDVSSTAAGAINVSSVAMPQDRWTCLQLRVVIAAAGGTVESWVDGVPAARLDNVGTLPATGYRNVHAGLFGAGPAADIDLWTDEVAVGTMPIACD